MEAGIGSLLGNEGVIGLDRAEALVNYAQEKQDQEGSPFYKELILLGKGVMKGAMEGEKGKFILERELEALRRLCRLRNFDDVVRHSPLREHITSDKTTVRFIHRTDIEAARAILTEGFNFGAELESTASVLSSLYFSALYEYVRPHRQADFTLMGVGVMLEAPKNAYFDAKRRGFSFVNGKPHFSGKAPFEIVGVPREGGRGYYIPVNRIPGYIDRPTGEFIPNPRYVPWIGKEA